MCALLNLSAGDSDSVTSPYLLTGPLSCQSYLNVKRFLIFLLLLLFYLLHEIIRFRNLCIFLFAIYF